MITNIIILIIISGLIWLGLFCYRKGKEKEKLESFRKELKDIEDAKKAADDVAALDDYAVADKLRDKWTR